MSDATHDKDGHPLPQEWDEHHEPGGGGEARGAGGGKGNGRAELRAVAAEKVLGHDRAEVEKATEGAPATSGALSQRRTPEQPGNGNNGTANLLRVAQCWSKIGVWGDSTCPALSEHVHCRNCPVYVSAAGQLLDRELPEGYRREWTEHVAAAKTERATAATTSVVVFRIGNDWLALPTRVFLQVSDPSSIHTIPRRRGGILQGVVNVRGEMMLCVSLEHVLGLDKNASSAHAQKAESTRTKGRLIVGRVLVLQREGSRIAVMVGEVAGVQRFSPTDLRDVPATIARSSARYSVGILPSQNQQPIALLDDELLFHSIDKALAQ